MTTYPQACCAETGRPGRWHGCKRPATWGRMSASGQILTYCEAHRSRAESPTPAQFKPYPGTAAYRLIGAPAACICGPDHDCRSTGCDLDCPACC